MTAEAKYYGRAIRVVDGGLSMGPEGFEIVEGVDCLHQDLAHGLQTVPGQLYWDQDAGVPLELYVQEELDNAAAREQLAIAVVAEIERDPRVEVGVTRVRFNDVAGDEVSLTLAVTPREGTEPQTLVVQLEAT